MKKFVAVIISIGLFTVVPAYGKGVQNYQWECRADYQESANSALLQVTLAAPDPSLWTSAAVAEAACTQDCDNQIMEYGIYICKVTSCSKVPLN